MIAQRHERIITKKRAKLAEKLWRKDEKYRLEKNKNKEDKNKEETANYIDKGKQKRKERFKNFVRTNKEKTSWSSAEG